MLLVLLIFMSCHLADMPIAALNRSFFHPSILPSFQTQHLIPVSIAKIALLLEKDKEKTKPRQDGVDASVGPPPESVRWR